MEEGAAKTDWIVGCHSAVASCLRLFLGDDHSSKWANHFQYHSATGSYDAVIIGGDRGPPMRFASELVFFVRPPVHLTEKAVDHRYVS